MEAITTFLSKRKVRKRFIALKRMIVIAFKEEKQLTITLLLTM